MGTSKFRMAKAKMRHQRNMARIKAKSLKDTTGIKARETGKTIRSVATNLAATKGVEHISAADRMRNSNANAETNKNAIDLYNQIIAGLGNDSSTGETQKESTTSVGGSGSKLGG